MKRSWIRDTRVTDFGIIVPRRLQVVFYYSPREKSDVEYWRGKRQWKTQNVHYITLYFNSPIIIITLRDNYHDLLFCDLNFFFLIWCSCLVFFSKETQNNQLECDGREWNWHNSYIFSYYVANLTKPPKSLISLSIHYHYLIHSVW